MPDEVTPVSNPEIVTPSEPTPREALLQKYTQLYPEQSTPQETPAAQPEPVVPPVVPPPAEPPPVAPQISPDDLRSLQSELAALRTSLTPKEPEPPQAPPVDPLDLLRNGKYQEFVSALTDQVKASLEPSATQAAVTQALEMFRVESEVNKFLSDIRSQNPEIASLEQYGWFDGPIQQAVYSARQTGKIKSPVDYVNVYKSAVNAEVDKARKFVQFLRAAGKQDAMVTKTEVLRATPVAPSPVQTPRESQPDPNRAETADDYLARRLAWSRRAQGLND